MKNQDMYIQHSATAVMYSQRLAVSVNGTQTQQRDRAMRKKHAQQMGGKVKISCNLPTLIQWQNARFYRECCIRLYPENDMHIV